MQRAQFFDTRSRSEPGADDCAQSRAGISAEGACQLYQPEFISTGPAHLHKLFALLPMLSHRLWLEFCKGVRHATLTSHHNNRSTFSQRTHDTTKLLPKVF